MNNNMLWAFILGNKGVRIDYGQDPRAIWFTIEKTLQPRMIAKKIGNMVRALISCLVENGKAEAEAKKHIDGDYQKGNIYLRPEDIRFKGEDGAASIVKAMSVRLIEMDRKRGTYAVGADARTMEPLPDFKWDEAATEASENDNEEGEAR